MPRKKPATDVIVIGGGVIGLAIADALARAGLRVTLIERGQCGREASWAGAGIIQAGGWHRRGPMVDLVRESVRMYAAFAADLYERTGIDPQYVNCGSLELLFENQQYRMAFSEVKAASVHAEAHGRPVLELLSPEQAAVREPAITADLLGAKYCPVTSQVRNPRLMQALLAACRNEGVHIVEGTAVNRLLRHGERIVGVGTSAGDFIAKHIVLAAGSWSPLIEGVARDLMPVFPVRGQIALVQMPGERPFRHILERGRCYLVPRLDGRIIVGATQEPDSGYDKRTTVGGLHHLFALARRMVPELESATVLQTWAGLRPGTPDGRPYIGPVPGCDGLLAATGHFRSGLTLAPLTARIIADLILRGQTPYDLSRCAPGRPIAAPAYPASKAAPP